jgi:hypothetical protein
VDAESEKLEDTNLWMGIAGVKRRNLADDMRGIILSLPLGAELIWLL